MKTKLFLLSAITIGMIGYLGSKGLFKGEITDAILLANVEALTITETTTSWNCDGSRKKECKIQCGRCGTRVEGTGKTSGSHTCY